MDLYKIPLVTVPNIVFFPNTSLTVDIIDPVYISMIEKTEKTNALIGIIPHSSYMFPKNICAIGSFEIIPSTQENVLRILIHGQKRVEIKSLVQNVPYPICHAAEIPDVFEENFFFNGKVERLNNIFNQWINQHITDSIERDLFTDKITSIKQVIDYISMFIIQDFEIKLILLKCNSTFERIEMLNILLNSSNPFIEDQIVVNAIKQFEDIEMRVSNFT